MTDYFWVIKRPIITEKSTVLSDEQNKYIFEVDKRANKPLVKKAIETIFNVKVESVNIINVKGKKKRLGRFEGRKPNWKKAIVTLRKGDKIELFEST